MNYWIVKSEPGVYSFDQLQKDGRTVWDGVRNYQARNNLQEMQTGDLCFFYHSNEGKEIVGLAEVVKESYPDPSTDDPRWVVVEIGPNRPLKNPVSLETMKQIPELANMGLIRQGRLSVIKLTESEFNTILTCSEQQ